MPDREKVIKGLECCIRESDSLYSNPCNGCPYEGKECIDRLKVDSLALLKEQEEQKRKWLRNIADNQLSIGKGVDPLTDYEQGVWDGLQMAFEILTGDEDDG